MSELLSSLWLENAGQWIPAPELPNLPPFSLRQSAENMGMTHHVWLNIAYVRMYAIWSSHKSTASNPITKVELASAVSPNRAGVNILRTLLAYSGLAESVRTGIGSSPWDTRLEQGGLTEYGAEEIIATHKRQHSGRARHPAISSLSPSSIDRGAIIPAIKELPEDDQRAWAVGGLVLRRGFQIYDPDSRTIIDPFTLEI